MGQRYGNSEAAMTATFDAASSRRRCMQYRRRILDISQKVSALHAAPAFSCVEITDTIYHGLMRPGERGERFHDVFLMSKGHGCMTQYAILEDLGILESAELERYCTPQGILGAHPDRGNPGIEASTGSLGHGMGLAVGMAHAERLLKSGRSIFALLSDGELQEGSSWEGAMMAANLGLDNLLVFADLNDFGGLERMSEAHTAFYPVKEKFQSFGWEVAEVNGHDVQAIYLATKGRKGGRPFALLAKTVKGRGVAFMEHVPIWHYRSPNKEEYAIAIRDLAEVFS
jgi:transketolase